ncbi:PH domain-containing protein [Cryptosporangium phraense]|uniref:PH domain-containing protein n=1 Tax=Cryptosporangium phraense TaxID=2593070 RepID=A0A545ASB1_9ACTN|nr:PH domain-containing protein [Cryptosporangium phraense]TQS44222.1 PH domain-containing protein [Cryptosporangium phraense]
MTTHSPARPVRVRFRQSFATVAAVLVLAIGAFTIAGQAWVYAPIMLVPIAALWWTVRTGVDVDAEHLTVRGALRTRRFPWNDVEGFVSIRGRVSAQLTEAAGGGLVRLPAVTPSTLPRLLEGVNLARTPVDAQEVVPDA